MLEPTTNLLAKYNPKFTCLLLGAKWSLDNGAYDAAGGDGRTIVIDDAFMFGADLYRYPENLPIVAAKGGPGGKPGCGSLPDVSKNFPLRQLVTNTGWGTGEDIRVNPGVGQPWWVNFFPETRGVPNPRASMESGHRDRTVSLSGRAALGAQQYGADAHRSTRPARAPPPPSGPAGRPHHDSHQLSRERSANEGQHHRRVVAPKHLRRSLQHRNVRSLCRIRALGFQPEQAYNTEFTNISGLKAGNFVRIAGVEVGQVKHITIQRDNIVVVRCSIDDAVVLTGDSRAPSATTMSSAIAAWTRRRRARGTARLTAGQTIPVDELRRRWTWSRLDLAASGRCFGAAGPRADNALTGQSGHCGVSRVEGAGGGQLLSGETAGVHDDDRLSPTARR